MDRLWQGLGDGGTVMMPLDRYDWSEKYGWLADRWGLNWQIALGKHADIGRTVTPVAALRRRRRRQGRARRSSTTPRSSPAPRVDGIMRYDGSGKDAAGTVMHAQFRIDGQAIMAMDSAEADAAFNEAVSLLVNCEDQAEIDRLWSALSAVPEAEACGWLKDRFGVSWQIAPRALGEMMTSGDRRRGRAGDRRLHGDEEARPAPRSSAPSPAARPCPRDRRAGGGPPPRPDTGTLNRNQGRRRCPTTSRSTPAPCAA